MPTDPQAVSHFKGILVALLGVIAAAIGIYATGLFSDFFKATPVYAPIQLTSALGIDVLGAIVPLVAASVALALYIVTTKAPLKKGLVTFAVSVGLAFSLCHISPDGVTSYPLMFSLGISIAAVAVNVYPKPIGSLKNSLAATLALTLTCVPLSLLIVDLAYSQYFSSAVIGGNGLNDGLLLSTLYAPLTVLGVFSALGYASQMVLLVQKSPLSNKTVIRHRTSVVAAEKSSSQPK